MFWKLIEYLFALGIGVPILAMVYYHFTNSTNGTLVTWVTTGNVSVVHPAELGFFAIMPLLVAIMIVIFIIVLVSGYFKNKEGTE